MEEVQYFKLQLMCENPQQLSKETVLLRQFVTSLKQKIYRIETPHIDSFVIYIPKDAYTASQLINAIEAYCYFRGIMPSLRVGKISLSLVDISNFP